MQMFYDLLITFLVIMGFSLIMSSYYEKCRWKRIKFKNRRFRRISSQFFTSNKEANFLSDYGLSINIYQYQLIRYAILVIWVLNQLLETSLMENILFKVFFTASLFVLTAPRLYIFRWQTPFARALFLLNRYHQKKKDEEIYKAVSQLKNLVVVQRDNPMSADFLIEQLAKFTKITKLTFSRTLAMMQEGRMNDAADYFKSETGSKLGAEFANILLKLDQLNPYELEEQLTIIQGSVLDERVTEQMKQQELISNLLFIPIVATAIVILLNFVIITVWLDSFNKMLSL